MPVNAHLIVCTTLAHIDHALQSSWSGYAVIAEYKGIQYDLYTDGEGTMHEQLMRIIAPNICEGDSVETVLRKYDSVSGAYTKDWPAFDSYPLVAIEPDIMDSVLQHCYGLI